MPDIFDALSSSKEKVFDVVRRKYVRVREGFRRKKKSWKREVKDAKRNIGKYGTAYGKYFLFEFAPFVVAYGLVINFPVSVLLGWALTAETVASWGLVFYLVSEELTSIANELKPYIRVSAKVDN